MLLYYQVCLRNQDNYCNSYVHSVYILRNMNTLFVNLQLVFPVCHAIGVVQTCCCAVAFQGFHQQLALFFSDFHWKDS